MLIEDWDRDLNFWEANKKFLTVEVFRTLYDEDKSKGKAKSSNMMWGIAMLLDYESIYNKMSYSDRFEMLKQTYFSEINVVPQYFIDTYNLLQKGSEYRHIEIWNKKIDELSLFLDTTVLDLSNAEDITKIMLQLDKLLALKDTIEKRITKTLTKQSNRGGGKASLLEEGKIG